ncbi:MULTISPECIES: XrtA/PEP-CTERM system amidotransferase [Sphingobium]|uniref:asparagine synthase (glutamine-hydrolyzing) n=1 Tax=Sphingobium yanoikuyae ATCC 51230 TaxID=883163 RepID=K9D1R4_SPHYA|nr:MULTISPECIES: XrtA/PEP-CTERM system amidotransferase [Sphingobium]EKU72897.1 exosortase 1 system-associated amidotransferase 1 [Sphingobium yanoikuyae ATCC 51230]WQE08550.1 XrtA/PEP-CTERM system amidotransferase [Sphingobium yanoikuyae]SHL50762.1 asparagine synthase (glutamine-hydrolysing) [Sphingobium sp. YR657]
MCGIAGIFHLETAKPVDPARVRAMLDVMPHRGPDGSGIWTAPGVGLGHLRLSIIDLGGGGQPMLTEDESLVVTFNGEIYNFAEVRAELEAKGHVFRTDSDTEVILHGYRQWGEECVNRFNGMFAFALFDARAQSLWLVRDRLGVKPLHYALLSDGSLIFGSELKSLLAHPLLRRAPDLSAVEDYLAYGYVPDDACMVAGVRKLGAGETLRLVRGRPLPHPQRYWDISFADRSKARPEALEEELVALMRQAVRSRMVSDVPLGAFLSGGVDSSSVVALMAEASNQAVKTCTIGFDVASLDETAYADRIARRFATDHRTRIVSPDDYGLADTLAFHFDEPFADASALPTYRVCELAREQVTVALSGDGADEAFAGYRRHRFQMQGERLRGLIPASVREPLFGTLGRYYPKADWAPRPLRAKSTFLELAGDGGEAYAASVGVTPHALRQRLFSQDMKSRLGAYRAEDRYIKAMANAPARDPLDRAQYADIRIWLPGDILTKSDRMSMAVSLEAREPLLDHRLVEFAARLPVAQRIRGNSGKYLMKKAMEPFLPQDILYRPKMGFVTPISAWFRGALAGEATAVAGGSALARTGWFDTKMLAKVAADHKAGVADHGRLLWQMVMLDKALGRLFGA